jgi:hypothetical protein
MLRAAVAAIINPAIFMKYSRLWASTISRDCGISSAAELGAAILRSSNKARNRQALEAR